MTTSQALQSEDYAALLAGRCPPGIRSDWLKDHGVPDAVADECGLVPAPRPIDASTFFAIGTGRGIGIGSGRGRGSGSGIGRGIGRGSGRGIGSGRGVYPETSVMRVGQSYLIFLGDWHVVAGRVAEQIGPNTYELEFASKVDIEGDGTDRHPHYGDRWQDLAAGDTEVRRGCRHWDYGMMVVPLNIMAIVWHGDLLHPDAPKVGRPAKKVK